MAQTISAPPVKTTTALDVELKDVIKAFGDDIAVQGLSLQIRQGEFFSILGPSGCGKTTTLRMIAGFETLTSGELTIQGQSMNGVPAHRRSVNTVFQSYALFNHMSVWDNVAFGLKIRKIPRADLRQRVGEALTLVQMENFAKRYPAQLSGGQKQRVALARALVNRPAVMLLDEPLGALDLKLRKQMQVELSNLHQRLGITFIMVTHDQEEALSLSDRIAVMKEGRIEQVGSPSDIYEQPSTAFVADFIGDTNLLSGEFLTGDNQTWLKTESGLQVAIARQITPNNNSGTSRVDASRIDVSIRPEKIHLSTQTDTAQPNTYENCYPGTVKHTLYTGPHIHCIIELTTGEQLRVLQPNHIKYSPETLVYVAWSATDCQVLDASTQRSSVTP
ncbi:ABC transporter ATP-binding protein [Leptolyngbya cf. ectocarpi LEGE 11479]|uniref:Spermidine/putrescine import ATP-binding protein PotA n=1 Tax=Leptolyngbya cf. ectocarpi LEGE 11479 TaxID=1828722 RepID=A0A928ZVW4_LEPEC|nr:ABC transporter ATP-binding protein [Leptolyngbya ectocarpi]MBE9068340.1 ABC transporter ATP-binding protein [Leptolyngbya cf. ectocarpi LEGE 11479]